MPRITAQTPPNDSLIAGISQDGGAYTDAFATEIAHPTALSEFIAAFYRSPLFKAERMILRLAGFPGNDAQITALASGATDTFAAWVVEARRNDEILLADRSDATKSWLRVTPTATGTTLWFGSAIVPQSGKAGLTPGMRALIGPHRLYSRMLLKAAARGLTRPNRRP